MTPIPAPAPALDQLVLRSPDALVAAVPYLLGFHPRESAVAVWLQARRIALTQRLDLPGTPADHQAWLSAMWHHPMSEAADELILVVASTQPADPALVALVLDRAAHAGIEVRDALRIDGGRWWSLLCIDEGCCPPEGREVEAATASAVAAEFTVIGRAPLAAREDLETSLGPVADEVAAVAAALDALPGMPIGATREPWRDARIVSALGFLDYGPDQGRTADACRPGEVAELVCGLADVRVRDTVLWEVSHADPGRLDTVLERLSCALRAAPPGHVAPVGSCAAIVAWLMGDGARARIAIDRARRDDAEYSLALLLAASLEAGLPPGAWRESMAGLSRDQCRHGADAPGAAPT
jgi:hypothetical protein